MPLEKRGQPDRRIIHHCFFLDQGADTVTLERLSAEGKTHWKATQGHLEEFGKTGLRTLCLAYR